MRLRFLTVLFISLILWSIPLPSTGAGDVGEKSTKGPAKQPVADLDEAKQALKALEEFIRAYESGNMGLIRNTIDPSMIGYQRFMDGVIRDLSTLKQIRIHLSDTQVLAGPDVAVIQTNWEKRFLSVTDFKAGLFSGRSLFLLHRGRQGWRLAAVAGDNVFSSQSGVLAQLTFTPSVLSSSIIPSVGGPSAVAVRTEVLDPDLAGKPSLAVQVVTGQGDREAVTLTATTPGRFVRTSLQMELNSVITPGSGIIEVAPGTLPTTMSLRYLDNNPGSNRPPSRLSRDITIR
jgi:hypothetical protein